MSKISIVTISYNQVGYLNRAILSVLNQHYEDLEYIVVDAGSTDGSREVIEAYANRLQYIFEPDDGPADGLNKGLARSTGDLFGYLNADDVLLPGALHAVASAFTNFPDADVVYGNGFLIDSSGNKIQQILSSRFSRRQFAHRAVTVMQQSTFYRRETVLKVGGFNRNNTVFWDAELFLDVALSGARLKRVPQFWSVWTRHPEAISSQRDQQTERARQFEDLRNRHYTRLHAKALGVEPDGSFPRKRRLARIIRWISDPKAFLMRVVEFLGYSPAFPQAYRNWLQVDPKLPNNSRRIVEFTSEEQLWQTPP